MVRRPRRATIRHSQTLSSWLAAAPRWMSFDPFIRSRWVARYSETEFRLAPRDFIILCHCSLQIIVFLAGNKTYSFQRRQLLLGFGEITLHEECFAEMFVRAAVSRIKRQRLLVMSHRR